jgi:hypothetical protein
MIAVDFVVAIASFLLGAWVFYYEARCQARRANEAEHERDAVSRELRRLLNERKPGRRRTDVRIRAVGLGKVQQSLKALADNLAVAPSGVKPHWDDERGATR